MIDLDPFAWSFKRLLQKQLFQLQVIAGLWSNRFRVRQCRWQIQGRLLNFKLKVRNFRVNFIYLKNYFFKFKIIIGKYEDFTEK